MSDLKLHPGIKGTPWRSFWRHCAASRKVVGSIPDGSCWQFWSRCGPGVDSASNRNEYQEYILGVKGGRCLGLTALPPLCADCLEIWEPQPPGAQRACPGIYKGCFTLHFFPWYRTHFVFYEVILAFRTNVLPTSPGKNTFLRNVGIYVQTALFKLNSHRIATSLPQRDLWILVHISCCSRGRPVRHGLWPLVVRVVWHIRLFTTESAVLNGSRYTFIGFLGLDSLPSVSVCHGTFRLDPCSAAFVTKLWFFYHCHFPDDNTQRWWCNALFPSPWKNGFLTLFKAHGKWRPITYNEGPAGRVEVLYICTSSVTAAQV
jgi:hypothetical protein